MIFSKKQKPPKMCRNCAWYVAGIERCRRMPPTLVIMPGRGGSSAFSSEYPPILGIPCGEYKEKESK